MPLDPPFMAPNWKAAGKPGGMGLVSAGATLDWFWASVGFCIGDGGGICGCWRVDFARAPPGQVSTLHVINWVLRCQKGHVAHIAQKRPCCNGVFVCSSRIILSFS